MSDALAPRGLRPNPAAVYVQGLPSPTSRTSMASSLRQVAQILAPGVSYDLIPWHEVSPEQLQVLRRLLLDRFAARTVRKALAALRGTLEQAWRMGLLSREDLERRRLKGVKVHPTETGRVLSPGEVQRLVAAARGDGGTIGLRDAAVISVMYAAGLRRAEVGALAVADYDASAGTLRVLGKGRKLRVAHLAPGWGRYVQDWVSARPGTGSMGDALFGKVLGPDHRGGRPRVSPRGLSPSAVARLVEAARLRAGVAPFTPHDLRRSFGTTLLDRGVDLSMVQKLMGHESVNTTTIYDRRGEREKSAAVGKLGGPLADAKKDGPPVWMAEVGGIQAPTRPRKRDTLAELLDFGAPGGEQSTTGMYLLDVDLRRGKILWERVPHAAASPGAAVKLWLEARELGWVVDRTRLKEEGGCDVASFHGKVRAYCRAHPRALEILAGLVARKEVAVALPGDKTIHVFRRAGRHKLECERRREEKT